MRFLTGFIVGALSICATMGFAVILANKFAEKAIRKEFDEDWEDK